MACNAPKYTWGFSKGNNIKTLHKKSYKNCMKLSKKKGNGECFLFSVNEKILWELSDDKMESLLKISSKKLKTKNNILAKPIFSNDGMRGFEKNIIRKKDPSTFLNLKFIERKNLEMEENDPDNFETYKNVYIFKALFKNDHEVIIRIHPNFNKKRAEKIAYELSYGIGQLPFFLTKSYKRVNVFNSMLYNKVTKTSSSAMAAPDGTLIISVNADSSLGNPNKRSFQETLIHEAGHFVFNRLEYNDEWNSARNQDPKIISSYAMTNIHEDIAETVVAWVGMRCRSDRISKSNYKKVSKKIPNRIKFLDKYIDKQNYDFYPMVCEK